MKKYIIALIIALLALPLGLQADIQQVTLEWDVANPAPYEYQVFRREEGENYDYNDPVYSGEGQFTQCVIPNMDDTRQYYLVARAVTVDNVQSLNSNEVAFPDDGSGGRSVGGDGNGSGLSSSSCFIKALFSN